MFDSVYATKAEMRFDELVASHPIKAIESINTLRTTLSEKQILFGGSPLPTNLKPHFLSQEVSRAWVQRAEAFTALLEKLASALSKDRDGLKALGFSEAAIELLQADGGYSRVGVSARPDALWQRDNLYFVEYNSDSPAMMTYTDRLQDILSKLFPLQQILEELEVEQPNRTKALLAAMFESYREAGGDKADPTIAIVDWPDQKTRHELLQTAAIFSENGAPTIVAHPHELSLRNGRLHAKGKDIDIVQRRVLFPEVLERADELAPLLKAYRDQSTVMVNSLRSYLIGSKGILALLHDPDSQHLSKEEVALARTLIPHSRLVNAEVRRELNGSDPSGWVIKPAFGHGGHSVVLGSTLTRDEWRDAINATETGQWIAQRELVIPTYRIPYAESPSSPEDGLAWRMPFINWTPWMFGGRFAGGTARCSSSPKVSITQNGALLPALAAE
jgi:glutathionylspermidine synthase